MVFIAQKQAVAGLQQHQPPQASSALSGVLCPALLRKRTWGGGGGEVVVVVVVGWGGGLGQGQERGTK